MVAYPIIGKLTLDVSAVLLLMHLRIQCLQTICEQKSCHFGTSCAIRIVCQRRPMWAVLKSFALFPQNVHMRALVENQLGFSFGPTELTQ